jgi:hypothetical protein
VPQLTQRFGLDLPDAFAGDCERLSDFFERVLATVFETKPHLEAICGRERSRAPAHAGVLKRESAAEIPNEVRDLVPHPIEKCSEFSGSAGMPEFPQSLCFNLSDTLSRHSKALPNFFQSMLTPIL